MPNITSEFAGTDGATRANFNKKIADINVHGNDAVSHMTQIQKDTLNTAVQSATLGGASVTKSGNTLQFPAYPTILPANGGNADTLDGNHAAAFRLAADSAPVKIQSTAPSDTSSLWAW